MKAKIQFTVDMEDIPEEVRRRIETMYYKSEQSTTSIKEVVRELSVDNILSATKRIDEIRKQLMLVDSVLEDGYNILVGYASYQAKQLEASVAEQLEQPNE